MSISSSSSSNADEEAAHIAGAAADAQAATIADPTPAAGAVGPVAVTQDADPTPATEAPALSIATAIGAAVNPSRNIAEPIPATEVPLFNGAWPKICAAATSSGVVLDPAQSVDGQFARLTTSALRELSTYLGSPTSQKTRGRNLLVYTKRALHVNRKAFHVGIDVPFVPVPGAQLEGR